MQILIKGIDVEEPTILNGVISIYDNPRGRYYNFNGVNEDGKPFSFVYPYKDIEYFRKVGN